MRLLCSWMCRAHCHRVIKLSGTLQILAPEKELVENVHGVRRTFLNVGESLRQKLRSGSDETISNIFGPEATPAVYFIGKMLWSKGIGSLMELVKYAEESAGLMIDIDMYGYGPDAEEAASKASKLDLRMKFHGPIDHADLAETHKVRNCSRLPRFTVYFALVMQTLLSLNDLIPFFIPLQNWAGPDFYKPFNIRGSMHNCCRGVSNGKVCYCSVSSVQRLLRPIS